MTLCYSCSVSSEVPAAPVSPAAPIPRDARGTASLAIRSGLIIRLLGIFSGAMMIFLIIKQGGGSFDFSLLSQVVVAVVIGALLFGFGVLIEVAGQLLISRLDDHAEEKDE